MTIPRLILASASPARLKVLQGAGLDPEVIVSGVNEHGIDADTPAELSLKLAQLKAVAVAANQPNSLIIGCDSLLEFQGQVFGKPLDAIEARERWQQMRGHYGVLHTGHCLVDTQREVWVSRSAATQVRFATITDEEIEAYVATGEPTAVAGAFTLDGLAGPFISGITGDPSNVIGISLPLIRLLLAELGYEITDLWRQRPGG
ncbi:MAG TPA: Maf family protein [Marmoricola sp.]|nr:Maf family protein [Marmoricola sp.]HNJ78992.1 Maf family protein [Marmoricola sp.]HNN48990.1 Maf family protein [Marmoricola sp.]HNO39869.1 Maf family protein [Marmoricola sp.]